ncbi:MAG: pentapeptide repeat-containing protein [Candidatus Baltobacteraceae bacterium]
MTAWLPHVESLSRFIVAIILNSIWEDAILVFAAWLVLRTLRNTNASTRYLSWLLTMIAAVALPVITSIPQTTLIGAPAQQVASSNTLPQARSHSVQPPETVTARDGSVTTTQPVPAPSFRVPERLRLLLPSWLATVLFGVWFLIALIIGVRLAIDLVSLERLKRDSLPLPVQFRDQMESWVKAAYGKAREVRICVSDRTTVPVAVGLFDSMILLPQHLLEELSAGELDRISLHELAHLHRGDDWTNSVQRFAQTLLFFNPAIRFVGSQLDLEREVACDDWVLSLTGEVRPYATCLTRMAELTAWPHRPLAAPGVFVTRKGISIRIERLLNKQRNARVKIAYGVPAALGAALAAFFVVTNGVTPVIAYTTESAATTVASVSQRIVTAAHFKSPKPAATAAVRAVASSAPITEVNAPGINVHVPATGVHVPAIDVHVPAIHVPAIHVHVPAVRIPPVDVGNGFACTGCNFEGTNWAGKDMSNRSFIGANFDRANLNGTNLSGSNLSGVKFDHADLRNADLRNANLSGCNMSGADISGARFDHARISGCSGLTARQLDQAQLRTWLTQCRGCDFSHADFHGMDLRKIRASGMDFAGANFSGADLSDARFSGADFSHALFSGARLRGTSFTGCDFDKTDLRNADLSETTLSGSDLSNAIMR